MTTVTALAALERALDLNTPVVLWGPPGVGKTDRVQQACAARGWPIETVIAAIRQPDDFAGLPWIRGDSVVMVPPEWGRRLTAAGHGVLFLDELSCVPPATSSALLRVVLERVVGDLQLPPEVRIIAAANPPEQAAGGWDLAPPLANRLVHLQWPCPTMREWTAWALSTASRLPAVGAALVVAFLGRRPELILDVPTDETRAGLAWPSPRSWARAASLIGAGDLSLATELACITGCVGEAAAIEFEAWHESTADLPDPEELLANPNGWTPPDGRLDLIHAALAGVVSCAVSSLTPERWAAAWEVLLRFRDDAADAVIGAAIPLVLARRDRAVELPAPDDPRLSGLEEALSEIAGAAR